MGRLKERLSLNRRQLACLHLLLAILFMIYIMVHGSIIGEDLLQANFLEKQLPPSWHHPFGTDHLGRDMYLRTIKGLAISSQIGLLATVIAILISGFFSLLLAVGSHRMDRWITWVIDVFLSLPHMLLLILISVAAGKGLRGVILGLSLTHWTGLTRLIRTELIQIKKQDYLQVSKAMGKSHLWIAFNHFLPHIMGQVLVAAIFLFPHAIIHESAMSFLGFGLPLSTPAIGIILSEAMNYLHAGYWWLGFFPGLLLVCLVLALNGIANSIQVLTHPYSYHL